VRRLETAETHATSLPKGKNARDDHLRAARVNAWIAQAHSMRGDPDKKVPEYVAKVQAMDVVLDPELAARLGQVLIHRGLFKQAIEMLTPAIDPLGRGGDLLVEWMHANGALAVAEAGAGHYTAAHERAQVGVDRARRLQRPALLAPASNYLGIVRVMGGDWQGAKEIHDLQKGHADQMQLAVRAAVDTLECGVHARRGEHESGDEIRMNEIFQDLNTGQTDPSKRKHSRMEEQPVLEAWHEAFHAEMALHSNNIADAEKWAQRAREQAQQRGDVFGEGLALRIEGQALAAAGHAEPREVDDLMRRSRDVLSRGGCVLEEARTQAAWGELQLKRGDPDGKDRLRDALRTFEAAGLTWETDRIRPLI
jgi:tetratricopeptide (TPR) repeat protein